MSTNRRFSQTPPDRVNDLFERLLATSGNAVKTRERLLVELREELELLASLQEQHLFPVLRKHGMTALLDAAIEDNRETSALLAEIVAMPKGGDDFIGKIAGLKRVFQQHIRDDKKELLPAVLKAMSDEEAEAVIEKVEDEMASIEEAKRAEARRAREQAETMERAGAQIAETALAGAEHAQSAARTMQEAVQASFGAVAEMARMSAGQALSALPGQAVDVGGASEQATQGIRAVVRSGAVFAQGVQDVARECMELSQKRLQTNLEGLNRLSQCRTFSDLLAAQNALLRANLEQTVDNSRRIAELAAGIAQGTLAQGGAERPSWMTVEAERIERAA